MEVICDTRVSTSDDVAAAELGSPPPEGLGFRRRLPHRHRPLRSAPGGAGPLHGEAYVERIGFTLNASGLQVEHIRLYVEHIRSQR